MTGQSGSKLSEAERIYRELEGVLHSCMLNLRELLLKYNDVDQSQGDEIEFINSNYGNWKLEFFYQVLWIEKFYKLNNFGCDSNLMYQLCHKLKPNIDIFNHFEKEIIDPHHDNSMSGGDEDFILSVMKMAKEEMVEDINQLIRKVKIDLKNK